MTDIVEILSMTASKGGSLVLWDNALTERIETAIDKFKESEDTANPYSYEEIEVNSFEELQRLTRQCSHAFTGLTPDPSYFKKVTSVTVWKLVAQKVYAYGLVLDSGASTALGFYQETDEMEPES